MNDEEIPIATASQLYRSAASTFIVALVAVWFSRLYFKLAALAQDFASKHRYEARAMIAALVAGILAIHAASAVFDAITGERSAPPEDDLLGAPKSFHGSKIATP